MKKILFTSYSGYPNPNSGGPNKIIFEIIQNLDREKYQVDYLSYDLFLENITHLNNQGSFQKKLSIKKQLTNYLFNNFKLYRSLTANSLYLKYHYKKRDRFIKKRIEGKNYDIIHAHDSLSLYNLLNVKSKKILTIHSKGSIIQDLKDSFYNQRYLRKNVERFKKMEMDAFNNTDIVTFPSKAAKDLFIKGKEEYLKNNNIKIVYNGIDFNYITNRNNNINILEKLGIDKKIKIKLLNVAQHIKPKRIELIIQSVYELINKYEKEIILICVGKGPETQYLEELAISFGVYKNIKFIPYLSHEEVLDLMRVCDFLIMPSERVVFDMVILEALASGLCVIASEEGGNIEIIQEGINGYFIKDFTSSEILAKIIENKKPDNQIIIYSIRNYSLNTMITNYCNLYEKL